MKKILLVYGTRPEAIKMAPLILMLRRHSDRFIIEVCLTGQHREMLDQVNAFFGIKSSFDINLMKPNQTLFDITSRCLDGMKVVLEKSKPDLVFVQGDTTTAMAASIAAFYKQMPVAHLEAGLRSGKNYSPFPEEVNRKIVGHIATYHFAPTSSAARNLNKEGIINNVYVVGNSVIDALTLGLKLIEERGDSAYRKFFSYLSSAKRIILVTGHRRESFGDGFESICSAIRDIAKLNEDVEIVYPVHLNPNVREPVMRLLSGQERVRLIEPLEYPHLIWLLSKSYLVLTDSGGIQEEAPTLGKPVLVMREVTERHEGIEAGTARLIGTEYESIVANTNELLTEKAIYKKMAKAKNPYGDGGTSARIVDILSSLQL